MTDKPEKKQVSLVVSDIDNTISDYFDNWSTAWDKGIQMMAASRGLDPDKLYEEIRDNASGYARFHNFNDIQRETPALSYEGLSAEERKRLEKEDAKAEHEVSKIYHKGNKTYFGVRETVNKIHQAGAKFVMYTDSPASGAIARLADMNFPIDMIDGLVCRADCTTEMVDGKYQFKKAPMQVTGSDCSEYRDQVVAKLGDKLMINGGEVWKPNLGVMEQIIKAHDATPETTVMVGDNMKSDGGIVRMGVSFAWQAHGSEVEPATQVMYGKINEMSDYKLGAEGHLGTLNGFREKDPELADKYERLTTPLYKGFTELPKYYQFASAEKIRANEQTKMAVQAAALKRAAATR
ncbi:MAG: HAD hydrolase-like protein [Alphaproteobacteria bacterium]|nr:HAD hydrolase-like protein [Alphaproteobacteria bacterium]